MPTQSLTSILLVYIECMIEAKSRVRLPCSIGEQESAIDTNRDLHVSESTQRYPRLRITNTRIPTTSSTSSRTSCGPSVRGPASRTAGGTSARRTSRRRSARASSSCRPRPWMIWIWYHRPFPKERWCPVSLPRLQLSDAGIRRDYQASCLLEGSECKSKRQSAALTFEARQEVHGVP